MPEIYEYEFRKKLKKVLILNIIVIAIIFSLFTLYKYDRFISYFGYVEEGSLLLQIKEDDILNLNEKSIYHNNKKINYEIKQISDEIIIDEKINKYRNVVIKTDIKKNDFIKINILEENTTVMRQIISFIKETIKWKN